MSAKDARQPYQRIHDRSISEAALEFTISIKNYGIIGQHTSGGAVLPTPPAMVTPRPVREAKMPHIDSTPEEIVFLSLSQGMVATISKSDFVKVGHFKWTANKNASGIWYAMRNESLPNGGRRALLLHRVLMDAPSGVLVDHIDGDGLNNVRSNLRLCTPAQNAQNTKRQKNNKSGFKGVSLCKQTGRWKAVIMANRKFKVIGRYESPESAARAYDSYARELHGEFAFLNFPDGDGGEA